MNYHYIGKQVIRRSGCTDTMSFGIPEDCDKFVLDVGKQFTKNCIMKYEKV